MKGEMLASRKLQLSGPSGGTEAWTCRKKIAPRERERIHRYCHMIRIRLHQVQPLR